MKRFVEWSILLLVALVAIGLVVFGLMARSTGRRRDVAVKQVRTRLAVELAEVPGEASDQTPSAAAAPEVLRAHSPTPSSSRESDEALRRRWRDVFARVKVIFAHERDAGGRRVRNVVRDLLGRGSAQGLAEADGVLLAGFAAQHGNLADEIVALVNAGPGLLDWACRGEQAGGPGHFSAGESEADGCVELLGVTALADVLAGDLARGAQRAVAALELWQHLVLARQRYSAALLDLVTGELLRVAPREAVDGEWGAALAALSARCYDRGTFARELAEQAGRDLDWVEGLPTGRSALSSQDGAYGALWLAYSTALRPMLNEDVEFMAQAVERLIDVAGLPHHESKHVVDEVAEEFEERTLPLFSATSVLEMVRAFGGQAASEARRDTRRVGAMMEAFRGRHDRYPRSLDELAADTDEPLPVDPITGNAFVYCLEDDGCMLYSVGLNEKDEGGTPGHFFVGDVVWRGRGG